ncbi:serine hydrolase domain-containing protein [Rhizobium terrae]|uniref:serine hydrolase domain-containing protein n=1 Tax=Rhizobium terrae TaxID=2171756 RepID=UPI000E3BB7D3|nr:serine hydrolase [Rhizobium terrae]
MNTTLFRRSDINLANWRDRPYSTWAFCNMSELVPSAVIRSTRRAEQAPLDLGHFAELNIRNFDDRQLPLDRFLDENGTDAFVVMRKGEIVAEWYAKECGPSQPHLVFSISKSFTGLIAGILEAQGNLDFSALVGTYVPDAVGSAYGDVTVRDLFNMTVSVVFEESYLDETGDFDRYRRAVLWQPEHPEKPAPTLREFLVSLRKAAHPHGTQHAYRSPNSDMAGIVVEAAGGMRYADLLSMLIWQPMGAHTDGFITVDRAGSPRTSGGISVTARDLARFGDLVRKGGDGLVPDAFVARLWQGGDRALWAQGDQSYIYPGGSYRTYWYETGTGALVAMGIFGQWLWVDRASETVIVRLSAEQVPVNDAFDQCVIAMMKAVSAA